MISGNQSTNFSNFGYQKCLTRNLPADLQHKVRDISNYIVIPFDMLLAVISFTCNALVFVTWKRTKSLRHPSLLMLCSLSISDLIWALFTLVRNSLTLLHPYMCLKETTEKTSFSILCYLATLSNLAMISRDRYLAMSRPMWYRNHVSRSSTQVVKATLLTWLSSLLTALIVYILIKTTASVPIVFAVIFLFYVVCIVMILLHYIGFFVANRRHSRNLRTRAGNMRAMAEKEKKLTQIISVILLCFLLSFLPALISPVIIIALGMPLDPFRPFNYLLLTFNGLLNPLLNYGRNRELRKAMLMMLRGRHRRISQELQAARHNRNTRPSGSNRGYPREHNDIISKFI